MDTDQDFSAFATARWGPLVRSAVILGCTTDEAHDLVQVTLLRCYTRWTKVCRAENPDAYVYRILLNCHRDTRRRRWWRERPAEALPEQTGEDPTQAVDVTDSVQRALASLSRVHREVVALRYYAHLNEQQTADILGVPAGTVKSRLSRALNQLSKNPHLLDLSQGHER